MITTETRKGRASWSLSQGWTHPGTQYQGEVISSEETIVGYRGPRLADSMHDVNHTKMVVARQSARLVSYDGSSLVGVFPVGTKSSPGYAVSCTSGMDFPPSDRLALQRQMTGSLEPLVNVPNMLLELPQTLNLWSALKAPLMKALSRSSTGVRARARAGSNALLAQQFGLFPLVGDLTKLLTSTKSIHSEVQRIQRIPRLQWESTTKKLPARNVSVQWYVNGPWTFGAPNVIPRESIVSSAVHYQQRRTLAIADPGQLARQVGRDLYGWSNPAAVLWEATPFSFVADWFYPIGDYLQALDKSQLADSLQIRRVCTCVKSSCTADIQLEWQSSPRSTVATAVSTEFKRYIGLPESSGLLSQLETPGLRQIVLAGALGFQRQ